MPYQIKKYQANQRKKHKREKFRIKNIISAKSISFHAVLDPLVCYSDYVNY